MDANEGESFNRDGPGTDVMRDSEQSGLVVRPWFFWAFALLLVYVLSLGPASRMHRRTGNGEAQRVLEILYAPLTALDGTPLSVPLRWWVAVCDPVDKK
jgi:hypothetical protein